MAKEKEAPKKPVIPTTEVKRGNKSYKWNKAVFKLHGHKEDIIAEKLAADDAVIDELLKIEGQTILLEKVEEKK